MTDISKTMGVSRSHQYDKMQKGTQGRRRFYRKPEDERYLSMIRRVIAVRITYGYRRVTAIINRELEQTGLPVVNPKRIYRLMKMQGLLLQKGTARQIRSHDGKVITNPLCQDSCRLP